MESSYSKNDSPQIFDRIARRYDLSNRVISFGADKLWRKAFLSQLPHKQGGVELLDLATGTGDLAILLAKEAAVRSVVGIDLSLKMLDLAAEKIRRIGLQDKIQLRCGNAMKIPFEKGSFDMVSIAFGLRNFPDPAASLRECKRVLRPGGRLAILESSLRKGGVLSLGARLYSAFWIPFWGGLLTSDFKAYRYLHKTSGEFLSPGELLSLMERVGFGRLTHRRLALGNVHLCGGDLPDDLLDQ